MSFVRVWIHVVFTTKNREAILSSELRQRLCEHIRQNASMKGIFLDSINGWSEHLHLLISLGREQNIANVAMLLKGESSHWFNQQKFVRGNLYWQDDYFALSVSESLVGRVRAYIRNQEIHHTAKPFSEEYDAFRRIVEDGLG